MAFVYTQQIGLQFAAESSLGVLPGSPVWFVLEPNSIKAFGAEIKTVARQPISRNRQRRRGATVDLDSKVGYEADLTYSQALAFMDGFMYCNYLGGLVFNTSAVITAVTSAQYTVTAGNTLVNGRLVYARGFSTPGNNGLKLLAGTQSGTAIQTTGLTAETPPANVMIEEAGVQGASGDITVTVSAGVITLGSTVLDFTTLPWSVGQLLFIGGSTTGTQFATAWVTGGTAVADRFVRIVSIAAHAVVVAKAGPTAPVTDAGAGKTIQIFYGRWLKNVRTDDGNYLEKFYRFEGVFPNLTNPYQYPAGNACNEMTLTLPLANKGGIEYAFVGTDTPNPTNSRATNAASAYQPVATAAYNSTSQVTRCRLLNYDETALQSSSPSAFFKSLSAKIMNNVTPEKAIGVLGAVAMPNGIFEVDVDAEVMFTNDDLIAALRTYRQIALDMAVVNDDGCIAIDMPSFSLTKNVPQFPVNQVVKLKLTGEPWQDPTLGYSMSVNFLPFVPHT